MDLNKNRELLFWLLQIVGFSMMNSILFMLPNLTITFKFFSFITASALGIIVTSIYRLYLKKEFNIDAINYKSIYKLFIALIICSLAYFVVGLASDELYDVFFHKTEEEINLIKENGSFIVASITSFFTVFGWSVIYFSIKFISNSNKNRLETLELNSILKEAQLNTLKGQINPHFMFNSLNNIRGLMLEDVTKSREMITKLSEMLQFALSKNTVDAIALSEEIEMVDNYIALAKIQMEDRLTYIKKIDSESETIKIPPMVVQLLVENAAKHGISKLKQGGSIKLITKVEEKELNITVSNTGSLSIDKESTKLGLKNIEQRLYLLYGKNALFTLEEISGEVVACIKIPIA
ncbi:histidine kinase [Cellulophaga sp. HaHaR_3_176]|nr:histidine kinase [Cellulophaga sp. HaHaR_3_176]